MLAMAASADKTNDLGALNSTKERLLHKVFPPVSPSGTMPCQRPTENSTPTYPKAADHPEPRSAEMCENVHLLYEAAPLFFHCCEFIRGVWFITKKSRSSAIHSGVRFLIELYGRFRDCSGAKISRPRWLQIGGSRFLPAVIFEMTAKESYP